MCPHYQPDPEQALRLRRASKELHGHGLASPAEELERIAAWCRAEGAEFDHYGRGREIQELEERVATLLGQPAACFSPSGTMAQQIALRIHAGARGIDHVAMHPTAHVELHEERGYAHLHGLRLTLVGPGDQVLLAQHLERLSEPTAALLVELPMREIGGQLPSWKELEELKQRAGEMGMFLHLDGARLWEAGTAYGRSYAEVCAGFDSVYVSFYKGVGALPGALLAGDEEFVAEARVWLRRHGGNLFTHLPEAASAAMRLEGALAAMPRYRERAIELAAELREVPGLRLLPDTPHTNMMHVFLDLEPEAGMDARDRLAGSDGHWLFGGLRAGDVPGWSRFELYVGEAALAWGPGEARAAFARLFELAGE